MNKFSLLALLGIVIGLLIVGAAPVYAANCPQPDDMILATIDAKPGSDPNAINLRSEGLIPVALLGSATFSVVSVDPTTVRLHPMGRCEQAAAPVKQASRDVNQDGYTDIIFHFIVKNVGLQPGDTAVCLHGYLYSGMHFCGHDEVVIVGLMG
jgi:hypothetical protein